jgi:dynein heavy chain 2
MMTYEGKRHKCPLIREWKEMTSKVSDNMALVSSLKESRWVGKFLQTIEAYESKIGKVERALYSVQSIQRRWVYLEPILVGGALPDQLDRFNKLDQSFRNVMEVLAEKPNISTLAQIEGLESTLDTIQEEQEKCQKALNEFLEVKRSKFPRFYFLGDEDLLEILAQTQNPTVIQLHLKKLFAAIHSVGFTADNKEIT